MSHNVSVAPATIIFIGAEMHIDPPLLSAISALVGTLMGDGASLAAAIYTNATKLSPGNLALLQQYRHEV